MNHSVLAKNRSKPFKLFLVSDQTYVFYTQYAVKSKILRTELSEVTRPYFKFNRTVQYLAGEFEVGRESQQLF